jgi:hypothetical protein
MIEVYIFEEKQRFSDWTPRPEPYSVLGAASSAKNATSEAVKGLGIYNVTSSKMSHLALKDFCWFSVEFKTCHVRASPNWMLAHAI